MVGFASDLRSAVAETIADAVESDGVEVFQAHPQPLRLARARWVSVADLDVDITGDVLRQPQPDPTARWRLDWTISVAVGSGRQHTQAAAAEDAAWDLAEDVLTAIGAAPRVGLSGRLVSVMPAHVERIVAWDDDTEFRQVVLLITLTADSRGLT